MDEIVASGMLPLFLAIVDLSIKMYCTIQELYLRILVPWLYLLKLKE